MPALDSLPRKIGPYRVIEKIGEGGMGVVYLGLDADRRRVAIKVLGPAVASDPSARQRLAREVETMRRVRNRYVAEVLDADVDGPAPYIVTQYVPGQTLEEKVRKDGPLRGMALDALAEGLAEALAAIHAAGVIHRDLKPGNVMLDAGQPVIIDFGIAHIPDSTRLTKTGLVMGTPGYLAPEVIEGASSSGGSDVHSWGATVAYAATGRQPFGSGTYQTIFFRVLEGRPDVDGIPPHLLPFVAAALSTDPHSRPSARWLAGQLGKPRSNGTTAGMPQAAATRADYPSTRTLSPPPRMAPPQPRMAPPPARIAYRSPAEAARDVADLLPPVAPPVPTGRRLSQAQPVSPAAAPRPDWQPSGLGLLTLAAGVAAVALSVLLPVAGTAISLAVITLLRAADRAQAGLAERRSLRGVRPSDIVIVIVTAPWAVVRAALVTAFIAPLALVPALLAAGASVIFTRTGTLPGAGSWAAGAAVAFYCVGPGSGAPRRQLRRMYSSVIRSRAALAVAFISSWALALAVITLLRAADRAQAGLAERRSVRGVRPSDIVIVIVTAPWAVVRAALTTVFIAPLAIIPALLAAVASVVFTRTGTLPGAGSWAAGAAVAFYCVGPGSGTPRRQLRRMYTSVLRSRAALAVAFISTWALALAVVSSAFSQPPLIWPATSSTIPHLMPGLPSLGGTLHSLQKWLLSNTVGMLNLP